jgi:hypothetical protein
MKDNSWIDDLLLKHGIEQGELQYALKKDLEAELVRITKDYKKQITELEREVDMYVEKLAGEDI